MMSKSNRGGVAGCEFVKKDESTEEGPRGVKKASCRDEDTSGQLPSGAS